MAVTILRAPNVHPRVSKAAVQDRTELVMMQRGSLLRSRSGRVL